MKSKAFFCLFNRKAEEERVAELERIKAEEVKLEELARLAKEGKQLNFIHSRPLPLPLPRPYPHYLFNHFPPTSTPPF